jgi:hypothetical protein
VRGLHHSIGGRFQARDVVRAGGVAGMEQGGVIAAQLCLDG